MYAVSQKIMDIKKISVCYPFNSALHLQQKMGFEIIGTYKKHVHRGGYRDDNLHILEKHLSILRLQRK